MGSREWAQSLPKIHNQRKWTCQLGFLKITWATDLRELYKCHPALNLQPFESHHWLLWLYLGWNLVFLWVGCIRNSKRGFIFIFRLQWLEMLWTQKNQRQWYPFLVSSRHNRQSEMRNTGRVDAKGRDVIREVMFQLIIAEHPFHFTFIILFLSVSPYLAIPLILLIKLKCYSSGPMFLTQLGIQFKIKMTKSFWAQGHRWVLSCTTVKQDVIKTAAWLWKGQGRFFNTEA